MDELIKTVTDRAGITPDQAKAAVASVVEFLKTKMPGVGEQIAGMLTGSGGSAADVIGNLRGKFGL